MTGLIQLLLPRKEPNPSFEALMAEARAKVAREDALFDRWCEGPGKAYPTRTVDMSHCTAGPMVQSEVWEDGWMNAFDEWAAQQK